MEEYMYTVVPIYIVPVSRNACYIEFLPKVHLHVFVCDSDST